VLEFALSGPSLLFTAPAMVALVAYGCSYSVREQPVPPFAAFAVQKGDILKFHRMDGWFGYISVSGGFRSKLVLGSASTYAAGGIGRRMVKGDILQFDDAGGQGYSVPAEALGFRSVPVLRILRSLHTDLFSDTDLQTLTVHEYRIEPNSDRMGVALTGPEIRNPRVTRSVPAFRGVLQIPPSGHPLLLGPDGPTTGGYPQVGILARVAWTSLAQWKPGQKIRLQWTSREDAMQMREYRDAIFRSEAAWQKL